MYAAGLIWSGLTIYDCIQNTMCIWVCVHCTIPWRAHFAPDLQVIHSWFHNVLTTSSVVLHLNNDDLYSLLVFHVVFVLIRFFFFVFSLFFAVFFKIQNWFCFFSFRFCLRAVFFQYFIGLELHYWLVFLLHRINLLYSRLVRSIITDVGFYYRCMHKVEIVNDFYGCERKFQFTFN